MKRVTIHLKKLIKNSNLISDLELVNIIKQLDIKRKQLHLYIVKISGNIDLIKTFKWGESI